MSNEVISSEQLKEKFKKKYSDISERLNLLLENLDIGSNVEKFYYIYDSLSKIEEYILDLENRLDVNNITDLEERNRIIDQKIFKLFTPFILYYKLCLMENN